MATPPHITIDFETDAIAARPEYPPRPVGVAIRWADGRTEYLAWGHPSGNNCDYYDGAEMLYIAWHSGLPLLMHNAKFDLAVAYERMALPRLPWERVHDTMFLAFLLDPHGKSHGLKPLADRYLSMPPDEQDAVAAWIWSHRKRLVEEYGGKITHAKSGPNSSGAWISKAPGDVVAPYARGDVERTHRLFELLYPLLEKLGMIKPYIRERRVMPCFMENERIGIRVDVGGLQEQIPAYREDFNKAEDFLRQRLRATGLNFDADADVAEVFAKRGIVADDKWAKTKTGQRSVAKNKLKPEMFNDQEVAQAFGYRNRLKTCLSMFMEPWLAQAELTGGTIHPSWNQTRGENYGTRTGRPSCTKPNLLNISKDFSGRADGYLHPDFLGVNKLPLVRKYILPDEDEVFLHRDFDGQEMRIFAHASMGQLLKAYQDDPALDPHGWVKDEIVELTGKDLERTIVKNLNFLGLYGGGAPAASLQLGCSLAKAKEYKAFHDRALPDRKIMNQEIARIVNRGIPIRTWGGRCYLPEPPKEYNGQLRTMEWKLINYYCQGSAADITKEVLANWYEHPDRDARFLVTVYDECDISCRREIKDQQMKLLKDCMEDVPLDVKMTTSGKWGYRWGDIEAYKDG